MKETLFIISLCMYLLPGHNIPLQKVEKNGMLVSWEEKGEYLEFEVSAPSQGWLAVGFNEEEGLAGTHLIMAAVRGKSVHLSDRFILKAGDHRALSELGVGEKLELISGEENASGSRVSFRIPKLSQDDYHKNLLPASSFHMLMAYSREDDFTHHSMMRTSVKITI
ncbi:MAG: DOMON domain-containing protein [Bacteroidia bacterium]|nr:DOMON domain-containing protein [Bacteroidia bacterium]